MGKQLVITEKPSVARDICEALGGFETHGEGDYFENDDYVVTFALGHLLELAEPQDYDDKWKAWTLKTLPILPEDGYKVKPREGQKKRLDLIKKLGKRKDVDGLINACDAGREGEIIFRRIIEYIGFDDRPHQRLWMQSMTDEAIRAAFQDIQPGSKYDALGDAAWLRGVGDWLIGMNATRALTKRLKGRTERGAWSAGRVQTPTLNILTRREREILAHVPKTYWEIVGAFSHGDQTWEGRFHDPSMRGSDDREVRPNRLFDRARVEAILAAGAAADTADTSETRKKSKQSPPLPFDLTSLQREANKRYTLSAKRTLNAAQRLYEGHKLLTYPRTDSRHLPSDYEAKVREVVSELTTDVTYKAIAERIETEGLLNLDKILDSSKVSDHFAIVPTGAEPPADLSGDDARVYELVVRQFLASLMPPAIWDVVEREVVLEVPNADAARFRTTARSLEVPGFLEALGQEEGAGTRLPALVPGEDAVEGIPAEVVEVKDEEKETRPPPRYNESQLLRLMETAGERLEDDDLAEAMKGRGLGTPATRADIIERLIQTQYARRVEGRLGPTPKAMRLMDVLEKAQVPVLASPELTGQWEYALQQVQQGEVPRAKALEDLTEFARSLTASLVDFDHDTLFDSEPALGPCPSCKIGQVVESAWGYRCNRNVQGGDDCKFILWKDRNGRYIDRTLAKKLVLEHKAGPTTGFVDRYGRALEGTIFLEAESDAEGAPWKMRVEFGDNAGQDSEEIRGDVVMPCPCGVEGCAGIVETNLRFVCQKFLDGDEKRGPVMAKVVCQRPMELDEVAGFFSEEGRTEFIEGFTSKRGRPFTGLLFRKPTGKHGFEFPPRAPRGKKGADGEAAPAKKPAAKKAAAKKPAAKKPAAKKPAAKKPAAKKPAAKKAAAKKPADD